MAQRVRSCSNSTNLDTINCDSYMMRLLKRDKAAAGGRQRLPPEQTGRGPRSQTATLRPNKQQTNLTRKELPVDSSGVVEVMVRKHSCRRPRADCAKSREPWDKILQSAKSNENLSSFSNFDPLRTLHFLTKELQSKLKRSASDDPHMLQMISDIQHALKRVPLEVASSIRLPRGENLPLKRSTSEIRGPGKALAHNQVEIPEKLVQTSKQTQARSCQTFESGAFFPAPELFQRQLEASTAKLEESCLQLEKLCNQLRNEKEHLERLLASEKDTVKFLRRQIEDMEVEKTGLVNFSVEQLKQEKSNLQTQLKRLQAQAEAQQNSALQELKYYNQLKSEKEQMELLLKAEKDTVKLLQKQIEEMEVDKMRQTNFAVEQLKQEKINLQAQLKKLQDSHQGQDLKSLVQKLQAEKTSVQEENMTLRHDLTVCSMEKEKYMAILDVRDRQISEIRSEMVQLQEVVNEQLFELQKSPLISSPSSLSTLGNFGNGLWLQKNQELPDTLLDGNSPLTGMLRKDVQLLHPYRELSSGDGSISNLESVNKNVSECGTVTPNVVKLFQQQKSAGARI